MAAAAAAAEAARARERAEQEKRDKKMREAQTEADKGAEVLRRAFASLPGPLRERYPQQCAAFAAVQMPLLAQTQARCAPLLLEALACSLPRPLAMKTGAGTGTGTGW